MHFYLDPQTDIAFDQFIRNIQGSLNQFNKSIDDFRVAIGSSAQTVGKALQSLGETLKTIPDPTTRHYGIGLVLYGEILDKGFGIIDATKKEELLNWTSNEIIADIFASIGVLGIHHLAAVGLSIVLGTPIEGGFLALALMAGANPVGSLIAVSAVVFGMKLLGDAIAPEIYSGLKGLLSVKNDPLVIDLDGDGIELTALGVAGQEGASGIHFDYDRDGFGERTAWVKADDGLLAIDDNGNGLVDGIGELFGSPSQDGFAVLETLDTNHDGVISAGDREFSKLRIWRDLNQNGATDAGELQTLDEAGITSISLSRSDVAGTNAGNDRGFQSTVTFAGGATRIAESIYFQTDRAATVDTTPEFTLAEGVDLLPQLGGSGQIHSLAWKASTDAAFRAEWTGDRNMGNLSHPNLFDRHLH